MNKSTDPGTAGNAPRGLVSLQRGWLTPRAYQG